MAKLLLLMLCFPKLHLQVGDLPEDQITLRALRDVNVPKFLKATVSERPFSGVCGWDRGEEVQQV